MCAQAAKPRVLAHVVSYNSEETIAACAERLLQSTGFEKNCLKFEITDNASSDETPQILRSLPDDQIELFLLDENSGFCRAHNEAYQRAIEFHADYLALVNPDVGVRPDTLLKLVECLEADPSAAAVTPKLLRADSELSPIAPQTIDAAGMYLTSSFRHFDRGSSENDRGQFEEPQYVYGATGALLVLRMSAIRDFLVADAESQILDERFFAYREDADLAWRINISGWRCRYEPLASAQHVRRVTHDRRAQLSNTINSLGVRNRFLLQFGNFTWADCWSSTPATLVRNLLVTGAAVSIERTSFPALREAFAKFSEMTARCRLQEKNRKAARGAMSYWFRGSKAVESALAPSPAAEKIRTVRAVIVNYNAGNRLNACVAALEQAARTLEHSRRIEIIILDNASADASAVRLEARYKENPRISFNFQASNLGFAGGINTALAGANYDAALILNPDVIVSAAAIERLCKTIDLFPAAGLAAPVLTDAVGEVQRGFTVRRFPSLASITAETLGLHALWPNNPWTSRQRCCSNWDWRLNAALERDSSAVPYEQTLPLCVEQPAAACIMIRAKAFQELGGFDERFWPAWFEDVDFCRRLSDGGWKSLICSEARVVHEGGYSLSVIKRSGFLKAWYPNLFRYWALHHSEPSVLALHIIVRFGILLRIAATPLQLVFASDSEERTELFSALKAHCLLLLKPNAVSSPQRLDSPINAIGEKISRSAKHVSSVCSAALNSSGHQPANGGAVHSVDGAWLKSLPEALQGSGLQISTQSIELSNQALLTVIESPGVRGKQRSNGSPQAIKADLRTDIEALKGVIDDSYDFLVAIDVIQETTSPLRALMNWTRVVKPRGLLYLTLPRVEPVTVHCEETTLEHIIADYLRPSSERDLEHYVEYAASALGVSGSAAISEARNLQAAANRIPMHSLTSKTLKELIEWSAKHVCPLELAQDSVITADSGRSHWLIRAL
ncbi:MAG: glycosyltransferase [Bdellovibrionales bacterium]|nr:glycosyltransferase [Bdellovibrionales bacterium]